MAMENLAQVYESQGKLLEAEPLYLYALANDCDNLATLTAVGSLAALYGSLGRYEESEVLCFEVYEDLNRTMGPDHLSTLEAMNNLASFYLAGSKFGQAETLLVQVLDGFRKTHGNESPETILLINNLATRYDVQELEPTWSPPLQQGHMTSIARSIDRSIDRMFGILQLKTTRFPPIKGIDPTSFARSIAKGPHFSARPLHTTSLEPEQSPVQLQSTPFPPFENFNMSKHTCSVYRIRGVRAWEGALEVHVKALSKPPLFAGIAH
ncbi:hypothetical protein BJ742DRAFT_875120 [Cladochytrium replicatum]|nr:hypothetical protein BJ742DRAFT_875120 [Cladochytrium replicatum]